jgi:hypothetical protein
MALLESDFNFTGPVGNLSAYRMRGVDKIILRKKGGASKKRIQTDPGFERTRLNNSEFSGRAQGVHWMMRALRPLKPVIDHNICGKINKLMKHVQDRDDVSRFGKRTIFLSKHGAVLEGFSLNRRAVFEDYVRTTIRHAISRETLTAKIDLPELVPGLNFFLPQNHPFFSVRAVLSIVPDLYWTDRGYQPQPAVFPRTYPNTTTTQWLPVNQGMPATTLELKFDIVAPDNNYALVLSVGICFAYPNGGDMKDVAHVGCGKVVAVV